MSSFRYEVNTDLKGEGGKYPFTTPIPNANTKLNGKKKERKKKNSCIFTHLYTITILFRDTLSHPLNIMPHLFSPNKDKKKKK